MKIQEYINDRNKYAVDTTYQRQEGAWSKEDMQCLIDTILRGEPMPMFFLNYKSSEKKYYVVDGQQRLYCISQFYDNKVKLNSKFSGKEKDGQTFNGQNPLSKEDKNIFLNYDLKFHILEDYNDEKVRLIFSRLQRGKPLSLGERLNAMPGTIVELMRDLSKHPFIDKSIGISKNNYGSYPDVARILFYEKHGDRNSSTDDLYKFFSDNDSLTKKSTEYKNAISILNILEKCFPPEPGNYKYLEKHAWVIAVYTMIRELKFFYSLNGQESTVRAFIENFHDHVYNEDFRKSNQNYQRFYDNIRGGWSEKIIKLRKEILVKEFLNKYKLTELDDKRQISNEEKIIAFAKCEHKCEKCGIPLKDYKEPEYHHIERYTDGGRSKLDNIMVLCSDCHNKIHSIGRMDLPTEDDFEEIE